MSSELADRIARLTGLPVRSVRPVGAQHGYQHLEITFADGTRGFGKVSASGSARAAASVLPTNPENGGGRAFAAEANGLRWLAEARAVPIPEVLGADDSALIISMIAVDSAIPGAASQVSGQAAHRFGADLARLHAAGADSFGAPWPGVIASLPLDNTPGESWPEWYAEHRLRPFLRLAASAGLLHDEDVSLVEAVINRLASLAGPPEPPSRIHGDCWSGNILWSGGRGWLIDPAAHGGHRETDLAMLALFGAPYLSAALEGYTETAPLAAGWQDRVPLHQLHPLLVHVCLFGESYRSAVCAAARSALST
ncbi:MAG TPA: fructosamine kinase family protein [Streptosporangiaceae bacterium]